jgi:hypothetical protein
MKGDDGRCSHEKPQAEAEGAMRAKGLARSLCADDADGADDETEQAAAQVRARAAVARRRKRAGERKRDGVRDDVRI